MHGTCNQKLPSPPYTHTHTKWSLTSSSSWWGRPVSGVDLDVAIAYTRTTDKGWWLRWPVTRHFLIHITLTHTHTHTHAHTPHTQTRTPHTHTQTRTPHTHSNTHTTHTPHTHVLLVLFDCFVHRLLRIQGDDSLSGVPAVAVINNLNGSGLQWV